MKRLMVVLSVLLVLFVVGICFAANVSTSIPLRSYGDVKKNQKAIVTLKINGKVISNDTLMPKSDSMKVYLKSQLIKSLP